MYKDIIFSSFTAVPSDYECQDGTLAQCHNLINEDGACHAVYMPKVLFKLDATKRVVAIHTSKNPRYAHYIIADDGGDQVRMYWVDEDAEPGTDGYMKDSDLKDITTFDKGVSLYKVDVIGNTLVILASDGAHYWLWRKEEDAGAHYGYHDLGTHLPELDLAFSLKYEWKESDDKFTVNYSGHTLMYDTEPSEDNPSGYNFCIPYDDEQRTYGTPNSKYISNRIISKANKFIADEATDKGRFMYPFFVRYAFRLYDGSYTMQSAPILMPCVTGCSPIPIVVDTKWNGNGDAHGYYESWDLRIAGPVFDLYYKAIGKEMLDRLDAWRDIITSIDIFISKPIYTYDINGTTTANDAVNYPDGTTSKRLDFLVFGQEQKDGEDIGVCTAVKAVQKVKTLFKSSVNTEDEQLKKLLDIQNPNDAQIALIKELYGSSSAKAERGLFTPLPAKSDDSVQSDIENHSSFYLLKSYKPDELKTELTKVEVKEDYLQSLLERQVLPDDYNSHEKIYPRNCYVYNSRVNFSGISRTLFCGFRPECLCTVNEDSKPITDIWVYINVGGRQIVTHTAGDVKGDIYYFYYPNANAYKAIVHSGDEYIEYPLTAHSMLNGACYFKGFTLPAGRVDKHPAETDSTVLDLGKIYTSAVNNPFYFPVTGINTVGSGEVIGIASAAKALSEGQFGQFPLYAFTTDGVWALSVNDVGGYKSIQPVTRDVCISPGSITQIDSSVLFATDRGVMEISGSRTECFTEVIDGDSCFRLDSLPGLSTLYPDGIPQVDCTFAEYRKGARMAYDYINRHIIIFNAEKDYAYVFSIKSKMWGIISSSLISSVNAYPEAYAMQRVTASDGTAYNALVDLSRTSDTHIRGLIVTRPIKLGEPSVLKSVSAVFMRGLFGKGEVKMILYGSRDNIHWYLIHSAKEHYLRGLGGTPYKYFRIAAITDLHKGETIVGASVQYQNRLTDQLR